MTSVNNGFPSGNRDTPHPESVALFHTKVDHSAGPEACWPWRALLDANGYGKTAYRVGGKRTYMRSHRFAALVAGMVIDNMNVLHRCDNPPCCNPAHLFLGSNLDNVADRHAKGRSTRGARAGGWKLTKVPLAVVPAIRAARGDKAKIDEFAKRYDMHPSTIRCIARGFHLGWVQPDDAAQFHPLQRGIVLRKTRPLGSDEVGIVLGPSTIPDAVEVVHGWIDDPPSAGRFDLTYEHARRGIWQIATDRDAATVRELFIVHAKTWGRDSVAWVAAEPSPGEDAWSSLPVAMRWEEDP